MKKGIIIIDPTDFFLVECVRFIERYEIFIVTNDERIISDFPQFNDIKLDVRADYDKVVEEIEKIVDCVDSIFTTRERSVVLTEKLNQHFNMGVNQYTDPHVLRDKSLMKQIWLENGFPTSKYLLHENGIDTSELSYPCIIKPIAGFSSTGVKLVDNETDLNSQLLQITMYNKIAKDDSNFMSVLLEEYFAGEEYSVDTFWFKGEPHTSFVMKKRGSNPPYFQDRLYYTPPRDESSLSDEIISLANNAVYSLGMRSGVTHVEVKYNGASFSLIEAGFRPGAGGLFYKAFQQRVSFDIFELYFAIMTGDEKILSTLKAPQDARSEEVKGLSFSYTLSYEGHGFIEKIEGVERVQNHDNYDLILLAKEEDYIPPEHLNGANLLGLIIGKYTTLDELFQEADCNFGVKLKIVGSGNP
ncbi:acetyl-CoA carboxylase biotin carboxylase subunit family protein [Thermoactinomyces sp. DSM 45892]|uniref:ATP-grasp domain-containing protein n=1 Tax=Thermoactinomyces sp. DSM 45892 TaxID=1882753 RepID=UPI0008954528|nr:ATP-grasp domain-containing protein [Thermoactinomyces sp. DSM 45892]SDY23929.1 ATP-grasp domain-containing protein [Thermoactinomyces sp. DSM 45892]